MGKDVSKLVPLLKEITIKEADSLVKEILKRFDEQIVVLEQDGCVDDPARPSLCRDEFEEFLKETIQNNTRIVTDGIEIKVSDDKKLGFDEELDTDTTDCVKIIGTILQGIVGEYVFVRDEGEGRFGGGFLLPVNQYRVEAAQKGWDPDKSPWCFSNFQGLPDFFVGLNLKDVVRKITEKLSKALVK